MRLTPSPRHDASGSEGFLRGRFAFSRARGYSAAMILKLIRKTLGALIITGDRVFPAQAEIQRTDAEKQALAPELAQLALYQFQGCPFCLKVRRAMKRMDLSIRLVNCENEGADRTALEREGGELQVPCLRIDRPGQKTTWLYESDAIIEYLGKLGKSAT